MRRESNPELHPALLWAPHGDHQAVRCQLCAHRCVIRPGKLGICGVRYNVDGQLFTRVYGKAVSVAVDPIEKKPLFHFHPGARALSLATVGCNFSCQHCQNYTISQWPRGGDPAAPVPGEDIRPAQLVESALRTSSEVIAYTYTEPTVYMEYALETARLAAARGLYNVWVTNGYMTEEAVELVAPYLHAANVDLKGMNDRVLRREVKAGAGPVLRTIADLHRRGIGVEVTTLVIPGSNDSEAELRQIAEFIAGLSPQIPWHVSRFHPTYQRQDRLATPVQTLHVARRVGQEAGLHYVYTGNLWGDDGESTTCPGCNARVIERRGFSLGEIRMAQGRCAACGGPIAGKGLP